jgi:cytochrome c oxidase assembly protein subunit 15
VAEKRKAVAIWLLTGVVMIIIQILLGGITRLTGSGLSITEWKPLMGSLPPLNEEEWQKAFDGYKQIAQYHYLNSHFNLEDFKSIFFWEWLHRLWARLLGVVFIIGFVYFFVKRYFDREMVIPFIILFILGALQGLIGWIMVKSGLNDTDLYVSHIRLAIHFIAALILLCYTLWFALQLLVPEKTVITNPKVFWATAITTALLTLQLIYGAFMAGLKAAPFAPTFPTINGDWIPSNVLTKSLINDPINVQFVHRQLAYLLGTIIIFWFIFSFREARKYVGSLLRSVVWYPFLLVLLQVILGIFTVLQAPKMGSSHFGTYELLAETHQLVAMFLLVSLVINLYVTSGRTLKGKPSRGTL